MPINNQVRLPIWDQITHSNQQVVVLVYDQVLFQIKKVLLCPSINKSNT